MKPTDDIANPNTVKVIFDKNHYALYFSRFPIPFLRGVDRAEWADRHVYYKHVGVYAYRWDVLQKITLLKQSSLELAEKLEQNRWIQNGYKIKVCETDFQGLAVDTPEDLQRILDTMKTD